MVTQERVQELFEYRDGGLYNRFTRNPRAVAGARAGTITYDGYYRTLVDGRLYMEQALVYLYFHGTAPDRLYRLDGDKSNNKIENLTTCPQARPRRRRPRRRDKPRGKGVHFVSRSGKWVARIRAGDTQVWLGQYKTKREAEIIYQEAVIGWYG